MKYDIIIGTDEPGKHIVLQNVTSIQSFAWDFKEVVKKATCLLSLTRFI